MKAELIELVLGEAKKQGWNHLQVNLSAADNEEVFHLTISPEYPHCILFVVNDHVRKIKELANRHEWLSEVWDTLEKY